MKLALTLILTLAFIGCAGLPSSSKLLGEFRSEHPYCTVYDYEYVVKGRRDRNMISNQATFTVLYSKDSTDKVTSYERRFHTVVEGWIEDTQIQKRQ